LSLRAEPSRKVVDSLVELEKLADQVHKLVQNDEEKSENEESKPELSTRHSSHANSKVVDGSEWVHRVRSMMRMCTEVVFGSRKNQDLGGEKRVEGG
jgi:hypothetical protein